MRSFITVIGKDNIGIMSHVSNVCCENNVNIVEVSQTVLQDMFTMIMLVEIYNKKTDLTSLKNQFEELEKEKNLKIHIMNEDIFNCMHKI